MIAVDTNLLIYAHRSEMSFHERSREILDAALKKPEPLSIPWPCIHEFLAIVTHARIFRKPTPIDLALDAVWALHESISGDFLSESDGYLESLDAVTRPAHLQGPVIHDARIAAICRYHAVRELWSADRDFSRFSGIQIRNPLLE